ncbi:LD-carboxypeptidase [Clostridium polyendosporum]|uniref:LD-carboxypeptidase n=1 Tax=Clostridium polyendosporum TaxID=69208 RepID=A0A919RW30_9CLOT|nr:S66 peptidase family protein [Clostridium polyendosporum]GIM27399.1 LD-carboxypeptidase [Clostridium polyendosporum]
MEPLLCKGDVVALISCSDGIKQKNSKMVDDIIEVMIAMGLQVRLASTVFKKESTFISTGENRAKELMNLFNDNQVKVIFDVSGGDEANQILPFLDFEAIKTKAKPYFGHSDLSVILNSLYSQSGIYSYHYNIRNLIREFSKEQEEYFKSSFFEGEDDIYNFDYNFLRGESIEGEVIGGNLRCFLKLAGTKYLPDPDGKILFLESLGGGISRATSYFEQLIQMGYLERLSGILLGTFTQVEKDDYTEELYSYLLRRTEELDIPMVVTEELGHGSASKCIVVGRTLTLERLVD